MSLPSLIRLPLFTEVGAMRAWHVPEWALAERLRMWRPETWYCSAIGEVGHEGGVVAPHEREGRSGQIDLGGGGMAAASARLASLTACMWACWYFGAMLEKCLVRSSRRSGLN